LVVEVTVVVVRVVVVRVVEVAVVVVEVTVVVVVDVVVVVVVSVVLVRVVVVLEVVVFVVTVVVVRVLVVTVVVVDVVVVSVVVHNRAHITGHSFLANFPSALLSEQSAFSMEVPQFAASNTPLHCPGMYVVVVVVLVAVVDVTVVDVVVDLRYNTNIAVGSTINGSEKVNLGQAPSWEKSIIGRGAPRNSLSLLTNPHSCSPHASTLLRKLFFPTRAACIWRRVLHVNLRRTSISYSSGCCCRTGRRGRG
jgi:hypothetical protein